MSNLWETAFKKFEGIWSLSFADILKNWFSIYKMEQIWRHLYCLYPLYVCLKIIKQVVSSVIIFYAVKSVNQFIKNHKKHKSIKTIRKKSNKDEYWVSLTKTNDWFFITGKKLFS